MLKTILCVLLIFCFLSFPNKIFAAPSFTTSYDIVYNVTDSGLTHAKYQGILINSNSLYYATTYKMQLGFDNVTNVKASDSSGSITPKISKNENGYLIELKLNTKSVGKGARLPFTVTFDTKSLAQKFGSVWEVNIPGVSDPDSYSAFNVNINIPNSFGAKAYVKPVQSSETLKFTKEELGKGGISIAFGEEQLYSFSLKYHIQNDNILPVTKEIAIPPPTNYQEVYITQISPEPLNVKEDYDGNWLAEYKLNPSEKKDIEVVGVAKLRLYPKEQALSQEKFATYIKEQPYWERSRKEIRELADGLRTPRAIYNYVINTLKYDFSRVSEGKPRLGAINSLKNPNSAVCLEFTDLFIALARAAGIPAREVNGFAYSENSKQRPLSLVRDILHSWPEYYDVDKKTWIMVDPTWQNTTGGIDYFDVLDLDHFTFVIKGNNSNYPIPAGGYKTLQTGNSKDINVGFTDTLPGFKADANVSSSFPEVSIAGLPITGNITIRNSGTVRIKPQKFFLNSETLTPSSQSVNMEKSIPPFGYQTFNVRFDPIFFLTNANNSFKIQFNTDSDLENKYGEHNIKTVPFYLSLWGIGVVTFGIFIIIIFIITLKIRRLRLFR